MTNCMNTTMHTDANTAQFLARRAPSVDAHVFIRHIGSSLVCVRVISIHGHRHAHLFLSVVLFLVSLYFVLKSFFHLFLNPAMVPDENSMQDPLCNSSFGSMVSLDYVTPDTTSGFTIGMYLASAAGSGSTSTRPSCKRQGFPSIPNNISWFQRSSLFRLRMLRHGTTAASSLTLCSPVETEPATVISSSQRVPAVVQSSCVA